MSSYVPFSQRLGIGALAIFWFLLALLCFLGFAVIANFPMWLVAATAGAGVLLGAVVFIVRWLVKRHDPNYSAGRSFLWFALGGAMTAVAAAGLPFYVAAYMVDSGPSTIPRATLSDGKKTVVFQGMQHVGSEGFYKSVVFDLEKALTDGYVLFYEGVQPAEGHPEVEQWFNKTVLGQDHDISSGYQALADSCGMKFQLTYFAPLLQDKEINPARHVTADVSFQDLKTEYERLMASDAAFAAAMKAQQAGKAAPAEDGILDHVLDMVTEATPEQKRLGGFICRAVLAKALSSMDQTSEQEKLILDYRNRELARFITQSAAPKIYVTYGAKHFKGLVADLKKLDPAWEVRSISWSRGMANPTHDQPPPGNWPAAVTSQ